MRARSRPFDLRKPEETRGYPQYPPAFLPNMVAYGFYAPGSFPKILLRLQHRHTSKGYSRKAVRCHGLRSLANVIPLSKERYKMIKFHWFFEDQPRQKAFSAYRVEQPYGFFIVLRLFALTMEMDLIYNRSGIQSEQPARVNANERPTENGPDTGSNQPLI